MFKVQRYFQFEQMIDCHFDKKFNIRQNKQQKSNFDKLGNFLSFLISDIFPDSSTAKYH